jgi:hypothetical protein
MPISVRPVRLTIPTQSKEKEMAKRYRVSSAVMFISVALLNLSFSRPNENNPKIIPPQARFRGLSYAGWEVKWQQAVFAIPAATNPVVTGGAFGEEKGIRFLTGVTGGVTVDVEISPGTALFFPIIVAESSNLEAPPFFGANEAEQAAGANFFMDLVSDLAVEIDGQSLAHPERYRVQTPQYVFTVPADNIIGVPGPATGTSVSAGFFVLVTPLSVGTHTIHFTGTIEDFDYTIDTTYVVTVTPR